MQEGNFTYVTTIFAVSDLLKLNLLQKIFKDLGFQIEKNLSYNMDNYVFLDGIKEIDLT